MGFAIKTYGTFVAILMLVYSCNQGLIPSGNSASLIQTFELKNKYLVDENKEGLRSLIHEKVVFCHSNCWDEDFQSLLTSDAEKKLDYKNISITDLKSSIAENVGTVRGKGSFHIEYNGQEMHINLCFVETYIFQKGKWLLLSRQSSKQS
jgi:hypothetical protein